MLLISKNEAKKMRELGFEDCVKRSFTKHPKYYLVEERKAMEALEGYRKGKTLTK